MNLQRCAPGCLTNETQRKTQKKSRRVGDLFIPGKRERQRYLHAGCKAPARHTPPPSHRPRLPGPGSDTTGCRAELVPARQGRHCQRAERSQHERVTTFGSWFLHIPSARTFRQLLLFQKLPRCLSDSKEEDFRDSQG